MLFRFVAKVLLISAGAALITALCLFSLAGVVLTIPYRRRSSARAAQMRAAMQFALAASALLATFRRSSDDRVEER